MFAAMVRWHAGPLAFGLEWMQDKLTVGAVPEKINGKQVSLSALYTF
jgi:hypothetical protein